MVLYLPADMVSHLAVRWREEESSAVAMEEILGNALKMAYQMALLAHLSALVLWK